MESYINGEWVVVAKPATQAELDELATRLPALMGKVNTVKTHGVAIPGGRRHMEMMS